MLTVPESSKPTPSSCRRWGREFCQVWRGGWQRLWPRLWIIAVALVLGALLVLLFSPQDNALLNSIRVPGNEKVNGVAKFLSQWGDLNLSAPLAVLIWIIGAVRGKVRWRKLGLSLLIASLVAGLIVDIFRASTGRPRPFYHQGHPEITDSFHGPHWWKGGDMQSFPSGHACSSATTGSTLFAASPVLALPGAAYAVAVSWSRMQLDRHHPIDVTVGATIGTLCGLCYISTVPGAWVRLKRRRKRQAGHKI